MSKIPGQTLVLMGMHSQEFQQRLVEKNPAWRNRLVATGPLSPENLSQHIAACDLLIQPYPDGVTTRRTSLMVALSHGKPILTTTSAVTESVWTESSAVSLTPCGDPDTYVKRLLELIDDPNERARLSQAARRLYQDRFDISHTIAALRIPTSESMACAS
jgi:glycosyltransferase involved in cell wall biosynthesis